MVLYKVPNDQIGIDKLSLAGHRMPSRSRAAFAAASRIWAKASPLPVLLASTPLSDRVPGCTRMVAWSPFTIYSSLSPGLICRALRISPGIVVCPLLVTVECNIPYSLLSISYLLCEYALLSIEWQAVSGDQSGDRQYPDRTDDASFGVCAERSSERRSGKI